MSSSGAPVALPALDKFNLVGDWIATTIFGINIILYAGCVYVLVHKNKGVKSQWILLLTSTVLMILSSISIGASLSQELTAFIDGPKANIPATLTFLNNALPAQIVKASVYVTIVFLQDMILIWRLFVVYGNNWLICIIPTIIEFAHIGAAYAAAALLSNPNNTFFTKSVSDWSIVGWSLELTVNISVTFAIAARLWYMGRKAPGTTSWGSAGTNKYIATIFVLVESGFIFAATTVAIVAMYLTNNTKTLVALEIASQLAATTPFLIVVRVGLGLTHGLPSSGNHAYYSRGTNSTLRQAEFNTKRSGPSGGGYLSTTDTSSGLTTTGSYGGGGNGNGNGGGRLGLQTKNTGRSIEVNISRNMESSFDERMSMSNGDEYGMSEFKSAPPPEPPVKHISMV